MTRFGVISILFCMLPTGCQVTTPLFGPNKTRISPPPTGSLGKADSYYRGTGSLDSRPRGARDLSPLDTSSHELDRATIDSDLSRNDRIDPRQDLRESQELVWRRPGEYERIGYRSARSDGYVTDIPPLDYVDLSPRSGSTTRRYREPLAGQVAEDRLLGPVDDLMEITDLPGSHSGIARQPRIRGFRYGDNRLQ